MSSNPISAPLVVAADLRHQLRTPLNHIIGYSEMLLEDRPAEAAATRLTEMITQARGMLESVQRRLGLEQGVVSPTVAVDLRNDLAGGVERVRKLARELRPMLPGAAADLGRIESAAAELAQFSPLHTAPPGAPSALSQAPQWRDAPAGPQTAPGRILVVDDNEGNRDMLSRQLEKQQHEVSTAADGMSALALLRTSRFDIVLLDLMMPGMNGYEVLETIKRDPALGRVAVILISALDEMDAVARSIEAGAEDYLFKPVNPTLLRARIQSTLDKLRAEEAISRKERFESIGRLAAGIAHDFNNLLTGIIGHAQLLEAVLMTAEDREMATSIVEAGGRAAELTKQLLAYAGKGMFVMRELDLSALVRETEALIRASLPGRVELETHLASAPPVVADANQIRQALLNLTMNAGESCGERGGSVTVTTRAERIESASGFEVAPDAFEPGDYSSIEVRDTGCGMDDATIEKIFEPFFSTKFLGRGLGLAAVAGIVRSHRGLLRVESAEGEGSCFRLYFPALRRVAAEPAAGKAGILVVDDEAIVRQIVKVALERAGYFVTVVESGRAAIEALQSARERIGLVLLDWKMPGMDGRETLLALREISPEIKVILSSGLAQTDAEYHFRDERFAGYLQKPYRMSELTALVDSTLKG
jgi:CheY-like chemotaxis protein